MRSRSISASLTRAASNEPAKSGEAGAQVIDFLDVVAVEPAHEHAAIGDEVQEAEFDQGATRLANRAATHPETQGDGVLINPSAGRQLAAQDQPLDFMPHHTAERVLSHLGNGRSLDRHVVHEAG